MTKCFKFFCLCRATRPYHMELLAFLVVFCFAQCQTRPKLPPGDPDNGGLYLPDGFEALVVVDSLKGYARHLAVNDNGDIYVKVRLHARSDGYGNVALRDLDNDGKADSIVYFSQYESGQYGTAMRIHNGYLYFSSNLIVYRYKLNPGQLVPDSKLDTVVIDNPPSHAHQTKPLAFDGQGNMYVGWGAGSDACSDGRPGSQGEGVADPATPEEGCPQLLDHGGIWKFDENKLNQRQEDGTRYATGLRSIVGMEWDNNSNSLYAISHGRDNFKMLWPGMYSPWESAMLPAEELFRVHEGLDGGWPYYYYDQMQEKKLLNPEYGGNKNEANGGKLTKPIVGFPGHFAPNDLLFYKGDQFPARYKEGVFVVFHGSTNRAPYPQAGYIIAFVPLKDGMASGPWEVFADGFAGVDPIVSNSDALYRPMGLSEGPDGSIYISDTEKGRIWRVMYKGDKTKFGEAQLAAMAERKATASNIKDPDPIADDLDRGKPVDAAAVYTTYCRACHQRDGKGDGGRFPPLEKSEWVNGDKTVLINVVLNGLSGPITVRGLPYEEPMPAHGSFLSDEQVSEVLTYIRQNFGNDSGPITPEEVAAVRKQNSD